MHTCAKSVDSSFETLNGTWKRQFSQLHEIYLHARRGAPFLHSAPRSNQNALSWQQPISSWSYEYERTVQYVLQRMRLRFEVLPSPQFYGTHCVLQWGLEIQSVHHHLLLHTYSSISGQRASTPNAFCRTDPSFQELDIRAAVPLHCIKFMKLRFFLLNWYSTDCIILNTYMTIT